VVVWQEEASALFQNSSEGSRLDKVDKSELRRLLAEQPWSEALLNEAGAHEQEAGPTFVPPCSRPSPHRTARQRRY